MTESECYLLQNTARRTEYSRDCLVVLFKKDKLRLIDKNAAKLTAVKDEDNANSFQTNSGLMQRVKFQTTCSKEMKFEVVNTHVQGILSISLLVCGFSGCEFPQCSKSIVETDFSW